ncbi:MAG TPA: ABC transporter substrate-binding protein, partial [Chloroflexota bacterium]
MEQRRSGEASASRRRRRSRSAAACLVALVSAVWLATACTPLKSTPSSATPATSTAVADSASAAARYRRSGPQATGASSGPIVRIGAALSLSGTARLLGMAQRSGIKLAQDEINASHMLGTTRLEIVVDDDGSTREQAATVFQRFIENSHVVALIGPTLSDTALSVDPMAQQAA